MSYYKTFPIILDARPKQKIELHDDVCENPNDITKILPNDISITMNEYITLLTEPLNKNIEDNIEVINKTVRVLGDKCTNILCSLLEKYKIFKCKNQITVSDSSEKKKKQGKPGSQQQKKQTKIVDEIVTKKIEELINTTLSTFIDIKQNPLIDNVTRKRDFDLYCNRLLKNTILEFRAIGFQQLSQNILEIIGKNNFNTIDAATKLSAFEIIISLERFIKCKDILCISYYDPTKTNYINKEIISELETILLTLKKTTNYSIENIQENYPKLVYYSKYDYAIINNRHKLYEHQYKILKIFYDNIILNNAYLSIYKTMTGSGKTTTALGFALLINKLSMQYEYKDFKFIFCCNIPNVNTMVAQLCYNNSITIGVVNLTKSNSIYINNYGLSTNPITTYICNNKSYLLLLEKKLIEKDKILLFFDEPTYNMKLELLNFDIIKSLPKWSILSSTTFPILSDKDNIIKTNFITTWGSTAIYNIIISSNIYIGSEIITTDGEVYSPYFNIDNIEQLYKVLEKIRINPIILRSFTSEMLDYLNKTLNEPKINELLQANDITKKILNILENRVTSDNITLLLSNKNIRNKDVIDYNMLVENSHKYLGMSMIATQDPIKFALDHFSKLINKIQLDYINKIHDLGSEAVFKTDTSIKNLKNIEFKNLFEMIYLKNIIASDKYDILQDEIEDYSGKELEKKKLEIKDLEVDCVFYFNYEFNLNSPVNLASKKSTVINTNVLQPLNIRQIIKSDLPNNIFSQLLSNVQISYVKDKYNKIDLNYILVLLLLCGIGVYAKIPASDKNNLSINLSKEYTNFVARMASNGNLTYLICDDSLVYGTNYPVNRIFITKDFSDINSRETIFQLMSRAGRMGKSWKAEIFIDKSLKDNLELYFKTNIIDYEEISEFKKLLGISETTLAVENKYNYKYKYLKYKNKYIALHKQL